MKTGFAVALILASVFMASCNHREEPSERIKVSVDFVSSGASISYDTKGELYCYPSSDLRANLSLVSENAKGTAKLSIGNTKDIRSFAAQEGSGLSEISIISGKGRLDLIDDIDNGRKIAYVVRFASCRDIFRKMNFNTTYLMFTI